MKHNWQALSFGANCRVMRIGSSGKAAQHPGSSSRLAEVLLMLVALAGVGQADWLIDSVQVGNQPHAIAINPTTNKVYVANLSNAPSFVSVIDGRTNSVKTVYVGTNPIALAVNPVTNRVYVANYADNNVKVIDGQGDSVLGTVAVGTNPRALAVNSVTNKIYVANFGNDPPSVTVIVADSGTTHTVRTRRNPYAVAVNAATNKVYVADSLNNYVTVIDGATNDTTTLNVGGQPVAVGVNPVTNKCFVVNSGSNSVTAIVADSGNATHTINVGNWPRALAVNPVTDRIYVANYNGGTVTVINGSSYQKTTLTVGASPRFLAVNPATNKIYVSNWNGQSISVIDGSGDSVVASVAVGVSPYAVAVNPVTNKAYVSNYTGSAVKVIDGGTNAKISVAAGTSHRAVAANPVTNKIYVANRGSNSVTVIDGTTNGTSTVPVGTAPVSVALNPVTNKVYVADSGSAAVTVIDGVTNTTTTVAAGSGPVAVASNPVTNRMYVANCVSNTVTVIDGFSNMTSSIAAGMTPCALAVNPATNRIDVANAGSNNVTGIDGTTNGTTTITVGANPRAVCVNPTTNRIYVANRTGNSVSVINGATNGVIATVPTGTAPCALAMNVATNRVYVANRTSNNVTVIIVDSANATRTVSTGNVPYALAVNTVTNKIYVADSGSARVTVIDGATNSRDSLAVGSQPIALAVNPVTRKVYCANYGGNVTVITEAPDNDTKVRAAFDPSLGIGTTSARPTLTGKGVNRSSPNRTKMMGVANRVNTAQSNWNWATVTYGAGTDSIMWSYNWGTDSLVPGENLVCLQPFESDAATANNEGLGTPFAGNLIVYPLYRLPPDVGTECILRPTASYLLPSWEVPPLARIRNHGAMTQGPFTVRFSVTPGDSYSPSTRVAPPLAPGETCTLVFDSLDLDTFAYTARCSTMLTGDANAANDARSAIFQGCNFINFSDLTTGGFTESPSGSWVHAVAQSPWIYPPMDETVWGDKPSGSYGNSADDKLTSPRYTARQNNPRIAFQHSFMTQTAHDGGDFLCSVNGSSWTKLSPCAGLAYNDTIDAPLDSGWTGNSSGWNQSVFTIPVNAGDTFRVRWRFRSDDSVALNGWILDEVAGIGCTWGSMQGGPPPQDTLALSVRLAPNPVRGIGVVAYVVPTAGDFSVKLYDITGALIARLAEGRARQGANTAKLDARNLAGGVYFVKLRSADESRTAKVIIN